MNDSFSFDIFPHIFLPKTVLAVPLYSPGYNFSYLILHVLEEIALTFSTSIP